MQVRPAKLTLSALAFGALVALSLGTTIPGGNADDAVTDPFLGQPDAIAAGRDTYRAKCYICHFSNGGRGPNLFAIKLTDEQFLETVINGRKGTQMPAFGLRLSPDEVWQVHAFIKSTDHY